MKKKFIAWIVICLLLIGAFGIWFMYGHSDVSEQQARFMTEIEASNTIVWYYGNLDPGKEITINYEKVTEFSEDTIGDKDGQYVSHVIVIFDFDGKMNISNEELLLIKSYCENNYYDMIYYGTAHLSQFKECGYFTELDSSEYGFTYNGSYWINRSGKEEYLNPYLLTGNWTLDDNERYDTSDKKKIWKFVVEFIAQILDYSKEEL